MVQVGSRLGSFEVLSLVGEGGMGQVWRARDTRLKREVALKVLPTALAADADRVARFQREAELLATLTHSHIAAIYGLEEGVVVPPAGGAAVVSGASADAPAGPPAVPTPVRALVLELVEGETLAERVGRGPLAVEEAVGLARQLAEALDYAHEHGVLHRDLKPANLKVTPDGQLKVLDFGLAKLGQRQASGSGPRPAGALGDGGRAEAPTVTSPAFTQAGMLMGTAAYMAPEQARGQDVDKRADIWAFGCVVYELLTGQRAFAGATLSDTLAAVLTRDPEWARLPEATPASLRTLLRRCLTRELKDRLRDIGEARYLLTGESAQPSEQSGVVTSQREGRSRSALRFVPWGIAIAAVAVAAGALRTSRPVGGEVKSPPRMTFTIPYPPGSVVSANAVRPTLSPDGRQIAMTARDRQGPGLWIYDLQAGEWRRLRAGVGTLGGDVIWSPDSRAVAFANSIRRKLIAVDLVSGLQRDITDITSVAGLAGSWLADGTILFSYGNSPSPVLRVDTKGAVTPATTLDEKAGETGHLRPQALVNAGLVAYLARVSNRTPNFSLRFAPLEPGVVVPSWELPGGLVFVDEKTALLVSGDTLLMQAIDLARGPIGEPTTVVTKALTTSNNQAVSATTDVLVVRTLEAPEDRRFAWFDRQGLELGDIPVPPGARNPVLSADGRALAFEVFSGETPFRDVHVLNLSDGQMTRVATSAEDEADAQLSRDGSHVLFGRSVSGRREFVVRSLADGTDRRVDVHDASASTWPLSWNDDAEVMLYNANSTGCGIASTSGPASAHGEYKSAGACRLSPDSRLVAFADNETGDVFVEPLPATGARWRISSEGGTEPKWHPNGRELYYLALDRTLMAVPVIPGSPAKFGSPRPLFRAVLPTPARTGVANHYAVAPDGRFIVSTVKPGTEPSAIRVIVNWRSPADAPPAR